MSTHRLIDVRTPSAPVCAVVVLHGGAARQQRMMVSPTQLSVLRMIPVARRIARVGGDRLAVVRLLNSYRGWDTHHTPLDDAAWAIAQVAERWPGLPVALVGHSLGGRAALLAAAHDAVRTVVALNPWVYPDDGVPLPGRSVLFVHGDHDRIARPERARAVADRLSRSADVEFEVVHGGKHAMLRHGRAFEQAAADFVLDRL
ncbi:serine aminopeptidase domain-containing protein [Nocardioides rubriscoriae]|uniref:serine aminopeptidase domain-containing protein n=1 Tax=Nocardioides rubriscoriae TaxID=642762 RepID=UPI0011DF4764|nr:alpha/beta hydrolase [Nocardioides rubriscoriae]